MAEHDGPLVRSALSDRSWALDAFLLELDDLGALPLPPFAEASVSFAVALSGELFKLSNLRRHPEIVSLAYWLRPQPIEAARLSFASLGSDGVLLVPRGRVFHVPPANVDTIFVYSWILSMLIGNANVVRLSDKPSPVVELLTGTIGTLLEESVHEPIARRNWFVRTGHDDETSAALSSIADVRVVWGGNATIAHFRRFPLPPRGRDLAFPNRHSLALLSAEAVARSSADEIATLAEHFFNDAYWFDQGGCSSPRLVIWHDPSGEHAAPARGRLHQGLDDAVVQHGYRAETGSAIEKMAHAFEAIVQEGVVAYTAPTNEATWIELASLDGYRRDNCGGGLFYEYVTRDLEAELCAFLTSQDQTAGVYGVAPAEIRRLAEKLNGRGIDRWVGIGRALQFDRIWDGSDLLQEFAKRVAVRVDDDRKDRAAPLPGLDSPPIALRPPGG